MCSPRLYHAPPPEDAHLYEMHSDGCWYYKDYIEEMGWKQRAVEEEGVQQEGIGDINSNEKGSGCRLNGGKVPMNYIPLDQQLAVLEHYCTPQNKYVFELLDKLSSFEKGKMAISDIVSGLEVTDLHAAAFVFQYGAGKYAPFNWMKGMPWSVPLGCISRHAQAIVVEGEELDRESGIEHWGHIICNVLMLDHYSRYYPEGDDRPPAEFF